MTSKDALKCVHEPFGDAWYFGPERLNPRYENDVKARLHTGHSGSTYKTIFDSMEQDNTEVRSPPDVSFLAPVITAQPRSFPFHALKTGIESHSSAPTYLNKLGLNFQAGLDFAICSFKFSARPS
jgi:hypothetical protein